MESPPLGEYLFALAFTYVVELPLLLLILEKRCGWRRSLLAGVCATGLTHPLLWHVWPLVIPPITYDLWLRYVVWGELLVAAIEAVVLYLVAVRVVTSWSRGKRLAVSLAVSVLVNAASLFLGMITWYF